MFKKIKAWAKNLKRQIFIQITEYLGLQKYLLLVLSLMRSVRLT